MRRCKSDIHSCLYMFYALQALKKLWKISLGKFFNISKSQGYVLFHSSWGSCISTGKKDQVGKHLQCVTGLIHATNVNNSATACNVTVPSDFAISLARHWDVQIIINKLWLDDGWLTILYIIAVITKTILKISFSSTRNKKWWINSNHFVIKRLHNLWQKHAY